jgi:hypothetical protein
MKIIVKIFLITICFNFIAAEELKKLSFEQVYQKKGEKILNDLPDIRKWADDKNYYLKSGN